MLYKAPRNPSLPTTRIEYEDPYYIVIHNENIVILTSSKTIAVEHKRSIELKRNYTITNNIRTI